MRILTVDNRPQTLSALTDMAGSLLTDAELISCASSLEALGTARKAEIDTAIVRAEMPELSGLDLGAYLIELNPLVNLIFVSDKRRHGYEAMTIHASGYVLEPVESPALKRELEELRHPELEKKHKRVFAQTFGNFELFVDGKPVNFKYSRTKELVAVLVNNRGAQTTNGEIIANLWEDDGDPEKKASYLSNLRQDLQNTFTKLRLNGIILKQRGSLAIAADRIECDLYDWLKNGKNSKYHYMGDYMNQYSWPEYVHAELDDISYALEE